MSDKKNKNIDVKPIKMLAKVLEELNLTKISYSENDFSITVARDLRIQVADKEVPVSSDDRTSNNENDYKNDPRVIKSPMVGTVYLQPEPGANKFVKIGDQIKLGQTLLIVEAMKTMNPIESTLQGKVIEVLIENEQAVEFGQPLMLIG